MMRRVLGLLSSKAALLWLGGGWMLYYVTLAVWSREAFARTVGWVGTSPIVQVAVVVFYVCAVLNLVRALNERYKMSVAGFVLWGVLPLGAVVFLTGFLLSSAFREHELMLVSEGESVKPKWQGTGYVVTQVIPSIKDEMLDIGTEEQSGIFAYEPRIMLDTGRGVREVGAFPPAEIGGTYYHILRFGIAPGVRLMKDGEVLVEGYMAQRILPPGAQDMFEISPYPFRFVLRLTHERIIEKGKTRAKLYRLKPPRYELTVIKGDKIVFRGEPGDGAYFDGYALSFFEPTYWVDIEAAKDPGMMFVVSGLALISLGLLFRLVGLAEWLVRLKGRLVHSE